MPTFSELSEKIMRGENLDPLEQGEYLQQARRLEELSNLFVTKMGSKVVSLVNPEIFNPDFRTSPAHVFRSSISTPVSISSGSITTVTFDGSDGDTSVFKFLDGDQSKIALDKSQSYFQIDGFLTFASNATGYREIYVYFYDSAGTELASQGLCRMPAVNGTFTTLPFAYTENIKQSHPTVAYMSIRVGHTAGAPIDLVVLFMSTSVR